MPDETERSGSPRREPPLHGAEKRAAPRRACAESLRFYVTEPHFFVGVASDVSTGGIFVQTFSLPKFDDVVTVRFRVPYLEEELETLAWVVWTRPEKPGRPREDVGFGGRFMNLPREVFDAISRYVSTHEPEPRDEV